MGGSVGGLGNKGFEQTFRQHYAVLESPCGNRREVVLRGDTSDDARRQQAKDNCRPGETVIKIDSRATSASASTGT